MNRPVGMSDGILKLAKLSKANSLDEIKAIFNFNMDQLMVFGSGVKGDPGDKGNPGLQGTYRFDIVHMYDGTLKSIIQPSYNMDFTWSSYNVWAYKHIPKLYSFFRKYICISVDKILHYISAADRALSKLVPDSFISWVRSKQLHVINKGFQEVLLRHPSIVHEFVSDVDCWEHIKPFGDYIVDGSVIHNMHWKRMSDTDA